MTKDDVSMLLTQSEPGETLRLDRDQLASHFPPRRDGGLSEEGLKAAARFAQEHNCDFSFDPRAGIGTFTKRPTPRPVPAHLSAVGS